MSKYHLGHSNSSAILLRWESAAANPGSLWILKCTFKLFIPVCCQYTKYWLFLHSLWYSAVIQSPRIDCRWRKATCAAPDNSNLCTPPSISSIFPIGNWVNEQEEMFHVALFRRLLFFSIWSSLLARQAGHSIRCFEPACSIVSLHFLFCLQVFSKALVALISSGLSALQTFIFYCL